MWKRDELNRPIEFSISFFMCDEQNKTGGDHIHLPRAIRTWNNNQRYHNQLINIKVPGSNHPEITVDTFLITHFNGMEVIL